MKFENYLENITGIGIYPMFSLIVFFVFFVLLGWRVLKMDKKSIDELSNIPLEDKINEEPNKGLFNDLKNKHQLN